MASAYDKASLVMLPHAVKEDKLYSVKPEDRSGDFTFSRGSDIEATRVNDSGLIEKAKVNLLTHSNDFSNAAWSRIGAAATSGQSGYDGSSNAWLLSATGAGAHYALQSKSETGVTTLSVYAKQGTTKGIRIAINGGGDRWANFNLDLGTQIGTAANVIDTEITSVGGGWYRISVTANKTGSGWGVVYILDNSFNTSFTASGETIFIQDAQLNYGLVAQDYVDTTTTAVVEGLTADLPRLDYSGGATCPSLLLEPSRTNLVTQSEYIGAWDVIGGSTTLTANNAISPEGLNNAYLAEGSGAQKYVLWRDDLGVPSAGNYVISAFFKYTNNQWIFMSASNFDGGGGAYFDIQNGVVGQENTPNTASIENYGNGWYRCSVKLTIGATDLSGRFTLYVAKTNGTADFSTTAAANGQSVNIYGFQLEAGSYPTSYIPTYGTSAGRGADAAFKTGVSSLIGQTEGTLFVEVDLKKVPSENRRFLAIGDGTVSNRIGIGQQSSKSLESFVVSGGTLQALFNQSGTTEQVYKIAIAYKANDFAFYINGVQVGTDTSGAVPSVGNLYLGVSEILPTTTQISDGISQALVFKTRLSNDELASLTTL